MTSTLLEHGLADEVLLAVYASRFQHRNAEHGAAPDASGCAAVAGEFSGLRPPKGNPMLNYAAVLIALSATVMVFLGVVHVYYTVATNKFDPRDTDLKSRLEAVSPVLSRQMTMWNGWIGFNLSHSLGLLFFGAVFGYLAIFRFSVLQHSTFLLVTGALVLSVYAILSKLYWFSGAFRGVALALVLYFAGSIAAFVARK